jgi:glutathione S-transferase
MLTLHHTPLSPACRKVRIMLREKELDAELVEEDFWERPMALFALNPSGEVPVLIAEKGLVGYGEPNSEALRAGKKNILYHLDYIAYLLKDRNWLAGDYLTLADITAAAQLSCLDYLGDVAWENHAAAKEWYALIKSRPAFRTILEDRITGFRPPTHYTNPDF